jgi:diguanylate cyclase (GGDEF)-like protein
MNEQIQPKNKILVIEDNPLQRKTVELILTSRGFEVIHAENGEDGLNLALTHLPSIILLDINLPGIDGFTVCRRLLNRDETKDIPVIMVTSLDGTQNRIDGIGVGARDYIIKPFHPEELIVRITNLIELARVTKELKKKNEKLEEALTRLMEESRTDELTGIMNRRRILEVLDYEISRAARYKISISCIMIDIDHFKLVNDNFGHPAGDMVLRQFAGIIQSNIRYVDHCGRIGGEEFLVLSPHTNADGALVVAERIRNVTENTSFVPVGNLTISYGCTGMEGIAIKDCTQARHTLLQLADEALYRAKQRGYRN